MSRRRRVAVVCLLGLIAVAVAHQADASGQAGDLAFLTTGLVLGEILVLRLEDRGVVPLSYAVLVVLASSFGVRDYAIAVLVAELASIVLRFTDLGHGRRISVVTVRLLIATTTYAVYSGVWRLVGEREHVAPVLGALAAAAAAQLVVGVLAGRLLRIGASFSARGRLAWLAIASSGMLMAIGYRGVGGDGRVGIWGLLLFSTPLLGAWYAFERLDSATRSYRQTIEALAMAPELGGMVPPGHAERVAGLASAIGEELGLGAAELRDLEMASLLHHVGQVTLDDPFDAHGVDAAEVSGVTGEMLRGIRPLAAAGDLVAGEVADPRRRLAAQALRLASEYDDLTVRDHVPDALAFESLRSAPSYVYDERVLHALDRVLHHRIDA